MRQVQRWPWEHIGCGKLLLRCICLAVHVAPRRMWRPRGRRGAGRYRVAMRTACLIELAIERAIHLRKLAHTNAMLNFIGTFDFLGWFANHLQQLLFTLDYTTFLSHQFTEVNLTTTTHKWKKNRSETCKHCALAVVRQSQIFLPHRRPPSRGRRTAKI